MRYIQQYLSSPILRQSSAITWLYGQHTFQDKVQRWILQQYGWYTFSKAMYGPDSLSNSAATFINGCTAQKNSLKLVHDTVRLLHKFQSSCTAQKLIKLSAVPSLCLYGQTVPSFSAVLISTVGISSTFLFCTKLLSTSTLLHSNKCFIPMKTLARDFSPFLSSRDFSSLFKNVTPWIIRV